ncbi:MAG: alcohol dehydrogenase catalytic domain-containing protein [Phycisphaerales bacterium]|nr:alcohol dehydrogenase catalytic domain-containing protein [Phycisphaerales bacterium]
MKGLIVTADHRLELQDLPEPKAGPYDALVKIRACGICSTTDREIIKGRQPYHNVYPCLLGHEAIGEVIRVGDKVRTFKVGDLVTRPNAIWPGQQRDGLASGWGGFAQVGLVRDRRAMEADGDHSLANDYTALRQNLVPAGTTIKQAVLAIALAETSSWLRHVPSVAGQTVCVGGTGIAGLSIALWCKLAGARRVIILGRRDERLQLSRDIAADQTINVTKADPTEVIRKEFPQGIYLYCEAVGQKDQLRIGISLLKQGGTLAVYGVPPDQHYDLSWKWLPGDIRLMQPPAEEHLAYDWAIDLMRRGIIPVEKLLTHSWPLEQFQTAFDAVASGDVVKGMLEL